MKKIILFSLSAVVVITLLGCEDAAKKSAIESNTLESNILHKNNSLEEVDVSSDDITPLEGKVINETNSSVSEVVSSAIVPIKSDDTNKEASSSASSITSTTENATKHLDVGNTSERNENNGCQVYNPITGKCEG